MQEIAIYVGTVIYLLSDIFAIIYFTITGLKTKLKLNSVAFSPQAYYTDRETAACWRS
jgi:hypothetical protein